MVKAKGKNKNRYDNGLTPEELEEAIAMYKAQRVGNVDEEESAEETKLDVDDIVSAVRERKDRRDSEEEQLDADEVIAEQESDIEALLNVIDELQAANDMSASDEEDVLDKMDEEDMPDADNTNGDDSEENTDEDDSDNPVNMDSVDKMVSRRLRDYLDVCRVADRLNLDGVENLSLIEAQKKVIKTVNPKLNLDGKSKAYINAAYDIAKQSTAGRKNVNDQRKQMMKNVNYDDADFRADSGAVSSAKAARERMIARRENGGKD